MYTHEAHSTVVWTDKIDVHLYYVLLNA